MIEDPELAAVVAWISDLAPDTEVVWTDLQMSSSGLAVASGWVDVTVDGPPPCRSAWTWEIVPPGPRTGNLLTISAEPDAVVDGTPYWTAETVSSALRAWVAEHTGRSDISFRLGEPRTS